MKKYFFIIGLLATMFLGLGNISLADCQSDFAGCMQACNDYVTSGTPDYTTCTTACTTDKQQCDNQTSRVTCSNGTTKCETAAQCSCSSASCTCLTPEQLNAQNHDAKQQACEDALPEGITLTSFQQKLCDCGVAPEAIPNLDYLNSYSNAINPKSGGNGCCVTESASDAFKGVLSMCTNADQNEGESCINPAKANAHVNLAGACVCNDKYTDVNGVCEPCTKPGVCCGVKLNTNIPFIGDCIETKAQDSTSKITEATAFPILVSAIVKILMSVILVGCFIMIIIGGVRIAVSGADSSQMAGGKKMIINVVVIIAVLGAIGVILHLINPNFFG